MRFRARFPRRFPAMGLLLMALLFLAIGSGSVSATETIPERIVWQKEPIRLDLTVGKERRVDFPGPVKVGLPPQIESAVRVQSIAGTVYLLAHREFDAARVMIRETESGRMYLLDVKATGKGGSGPPVEVYAGEDSGPPGNRRTNDGLAKDASPPVLPRYGYVTLTRFAAQQLYAPARLLKDLPGVVRVPVKRKKVSLVRGACSPYGCVSSGWKSRPGSCLFTQVVITDSWEGDRLWASSVVKVPGAWRKRRWSSRWGEQLCRP